VTINQRFSINEDRNVIDRLTSKVGKAYCHKGDPEHDAYLRERMLWGCLAELTERLIVNTAPLERDFDGQLYQPVCEEGHSICVALYRAIRASHLNTLEVGQSLQHKFDGELRRNKIGMQDHTSLSLFVDDVECLLRDLYGESDNQAINLVRSAVFSIGFGIGLPDGMGISGSHHRRMHQAVFDLTQRARAVRANPAPFSKYTVSFVDDLHVNWPPLTRAPDNANAMEETEIPF